MSDTGASTLFLVSIGPVQSFIASARKTRDLWAGSYLLSHLAWYGIKHIQETLNCTLIFPRTTTTGHHSDGLAVFPNRFLFAIHDELDARSLQEIGSDLNAAVIEAFREIITAGITMFLDNSDEPLLDFTDRQLQDFLEVYWVAMPPNGRGYRERHQGLESGLAARKNLRGFCQPLPEEGLKCSLCGEREALRRDADHTPKKVKAYWQHIADSNHAFRPGEYLCSICLGKRFAPDWFRQKGRITSARFPSTAEVAAASWKQQWFASATDHYRTFEQVARRLLRPDGCLLPALADRYRGGMHNTLDAHWLFEENDPVREYRNRPHEPDKIADLEEAITTFRKRKNIPEAITETIATAPNSYFAVLMLDGDRIGSKIKRVADQPAHQRFSRTMADFAADIVPQIVEQEHLGKLIYAGGDDLLALVNPTDLFQIMEKLRLAFKTHFVDLAELYGAFTASCGVCLSHYKNPLHVTMQTCREMEQLAKHGCCSRNGFAIAVLTHSGSMRRGEARWNFQGEYGSENTLDLLMDICRLLDLGILSGRFVYRLKESLRTLADREGIIRMAGSQARGILAAETYRLLLRNSDMEQARNHLNSLPQGADFSCPELMLHEFSQRLTSLFQSRNSSLGNMLALLEITTFINREVLRCD